jgi:putative DNA primase/helicase
MTTIKDANDVLRAGGRLNPDDGELIDISAASRPRIVSCAAPSNSQNGHAPHDAQADGGADDQHVVAEVVDFVLPALEVLPVGVADDTELANAYRLLRDHGDDLRFAKALGWLNWDGRRWAIDQSGQAERCMFDVARALASRGYELLALATSASKAVRRAIKRAERDLVAEGTAALKAGRDLQSTRTMKNSLAAASVLCELAVAVDDLDCNPWLFTCANGTIDLRSGALREHRREDLITRASPVAYDPNAAAPMWERFQSEVHPDVANRAFNQRHYGYTLTGDAREHVVVVCYGNGANGKSTEIETVKCVLADHAVEAAAGTFVESKQGRSIDNKMAALRGARMVTTSESGEGHKLNEVLVKRATGGDQVTANFLYKEPFTYRPVFKVRIITNHRPELVGSDDGIWRRMLLLPYLVDFLGREDRTLAEKLRDESSGILAWMVRGCLEWQRIGLQPPDQVRECTSEWKGDSDTVATFIAECCKIASYAKAASSTLYAAYRSWAGRQGLEPLSANQFGRRLTAKGYPTERDGAGTTRLRAGIGLEAPPRAPDRSEPEQREGGSDGV